MTFSSVINLTQPSGGLVSVNIRLQNRKQKVRTCLWPCSGYSSQPAVLILCNSLECAFWDDGKTYSIDGKIWRSLLAHIKQQHDFAILLLWKNFNHHHLHHHHLGFQKKKNCFDLLLQSQRVGHNVNITTFTSARTLYCKQICCVLPVFLKKEKRKGGVTFSSSSSSSSSVLLTAVSSWFIVISAIWMSFSTLDLFYSVDI